MPVGRRPEPSRFPRMSGAVRSESWGRPLVGSAATAAARGTTPLDALQVLAQQDVLVTPQLRHLELFTMRGLLTLLWHQPAGPSPARPAAVVACGGRDGRPPRTG